MGSLCEINAYDAWHVSDFESFSLFTTNHICFTSQVIISINETLLLCTRKFTLFCFYLSRTFMVSISFCIVVL